MQNILENLKNDQLKKDPHSRIFDLATQQRDIMDSLQHMWTENGDKLSLQYTGTNSNISGVLEEGKQGFAGKFGQMLTGVQRFMNSNFSDKEKQQSINILMGRDLEQKIIGIKQRLSDCLKVRINEYMDKGQIRIGCLTWNCAGKVAPHDFDVRGIVLPEM